MRHMNYRARSAGFSLVEVMVAVVVICVGLLGIAKMQAMSLSTTTTSRQRALAALQAASMASAMHSNRQYWVGTAVGAAAFTATITHGATSASLPTVQVPTDGALQAALLADITANPLPTGPPRQCITNAQVATAMCDATHLAAFDLARWWVSSVNPMLPNAIASVSCPLIPAGNQTPLTCIVQIQWSEKAVNVNSQSANVAAGQFELPTYTMYVQP